MTEPSETPTTTNQKRGLRKFLSKKSLKSLFHSTKRVVFHVGEGTPSENVDHLTQLPKEKAQLLRESLAAPTLPEENNPPVIIFTDYNINQDIEFETATSSKDVNPFYPQC